MKLRLLSLPACQSLSFRFAHLGSQESHPEIAEASGLLEPSSHQGRLCLSPLGIPLTFDSQVQLCIYNDSHSMSPSTIRRSFKTRGSSYHFLQTPPGVKVAKEAPSPVFISNANLAGSVTAFLRKTTFACVCGGALSQE